MARSVSQEEEEMEMTLMGIGWLYLNGKDSINYTERVMSFHKFSICVAAHQASSMLQLCAAISLPFPRSHSLYPLSPSLFPTRRQMEY